LNPTDELSNSQKITQDHGGFESAAIVERAPAPVEEKDTDFISLIDMASDAAWVDMEDVFASPEDEGASIDATSPEWQEQIPNWLDEDQLSAVMDAKTDTHFQSMLGQFHEDRQLQQDLTAYGMAGTAAQMFYTIADPVTLPLIVGTEAMAAPWIVAQKAGRVASLGQKIFRAGTVAGATEIAIATARSKAEADYTLQDAMIDVALVTGLSAPFGAFMRGGVDDALYEAAGQSSNRALLDAADAIESDMADDIVHDMGAAESRYDRDKSGAHRFDDFNRAFRSANRGLKDLATKILSDPVGGTNKSAAAESDRWRSHFNGRLVRSAHDNFKAWAKAGGERFVGLSPVREAKLKAQFSEELYKAVALGRHTDENIMKAAGEIRRINKDILKRAKQAGVKGFEEIDADANYIARYWDADKFRRQVNTHGTAKIARLIFKGLKSKAGDGADEEHLFKIALGMTHRMKNRSLSETTALHEMLDDAEELKKLLDDLGTSGDAEIAELVTQAKKYRKPAQRDVIARAKSRLDLDLSIEE
ncbi:MAG: hypothetical protein VXZ35_08615, partial [Pseudomonadota bacterium]|nr:hypothetical protein [Pseudomonadota bacterium]